MSRKRLEIGFVLIGSAEKIKKIRVWRYGWNDGGKDLKHHLVVSKDLPMLVTNNGRGVAVRAKRGGVPMLLDADLTFLSLTDEEKMHFISIISDAVGNHPA